MNNTENKVEITYSEATNSNGTLDFDQEKDHCKKNLWTTEYPLIQDLNHNQTLVNYSITSLKQNTKYICFVKVFGVKAAQSKSIVFKTKSDIPIPPIVYTQNKSKDNITLAWFPAPYDDDDENQNITFYNLDIFIHPDDQEFLNRRDYCIDTFRTVDIVAELLDYDNCCSVIEFERDEFEFISLIDQKFRCSVDILNSCDPVRSEIRNESNGGWSDWSKIYESQNYFDSIKNISANKSSVSITGLKHFTLYIFHLFACNDLGCGHYFLHSDRTAPDIDADLPENVTVVTARSGTEYEYTVKIVPPKNPNGVILLFNVFFRKDLETSYTGYPKCLSRQEFEKMNYEFVKVLPYNSYNVSVRVYSLAGPGKTTQLEIWYTPHPTAVGSWSVVSWVLLLLFIGFMGVIYFAVQNRIRIRSQRSIRASHSARSLSCNQNEDDEEDILMERMQTMHVDEYNPFEQDEHEL